MGFNDRDMLNMEMADKIVVCINSKDIGALYNLFSDEVRNNDKALKSNILKIYNFLDGKIDSYEKWAVGSTTDIEKDKNSTYYYSSFKLSINNVEYYLYYIYYPKNDFSLDSEGIKSLKVVKVSEDDKYFCYWQDMQPGIFLPDEAK